MEENNNFGYPSTKQEAQELGFKFYYTGNPCKNGHYDLRYSNNSACFSCKKQHYEKNKDDIKEKAREKYYENHEPNKQKMKNWYYRNSDYKKQKHREWYWDNVEYDNNRNKKYHERNKDRINQKRRKYYHNNKQYFYLKRRNWALENPERETFLRSKRIAQKLKATPKWANMEKIQQYYNESNQLKELTGIEFHVDHIIPLQGETVCGLHVEDNLQILPYYENIGKNNKLLEEYS